MFGGISFCFWDLVLFNTWMTFVELLCRLVLIFFFKKISDQKICLIPPPPQKKAHECTLAIMSARSKDFLLSFGIKTLYLFFYVVNVFHATYDDWCQTLSGSQFYCFLGPGNSRSPYVSPIKKHSVFYSQIITSYGSVFTGRK